MLLVVAKEMANGGQLRCGNHMALTPTKCQHKHVTAITETKGTSTWPWLWLGLLILYEMELPVNEINE